MIIKIQISDFPKQENDEQRIWANGDNINLFNIHDLPDRRVPIHGVFIGKENNFWFWAYIFVTVFCCILLLSLLAGEIKKVEKHQVKEPNMLTSFRFKISDENEKIKTLNGDLKTLKIKDVQSNKDYLYIEGLGIVETTR